MDNLFPAGLFMLSWEDTRGACRMLEEITGGFGNVSLHKGTLAAKRHRKRFIDMVQSVYNRKFVFENT